MGTYARIDSTKVVELFTTDGDITQMFHPSLVWVSCPGNVVAGWSFSNSVFSAPVVITASHADLCLIVLDEARALRAKLFTVVDGLQASALALGNNFDATAIENFKAGLRNITQVDLSASTTAAQMRTLVLTQYKALASAAPASVQLAFMQAVQ